MLDLLLYLGKFLNSEDGVVIKEVIEMFPSITTSNTVKTLRVLGIVKKVKNKFFYIDEQINLIDDDVTAKAVLILQSKVYNWPQQKFIDFVNSEFKGKIDIMNDEVDWNDKIEKTKEVKLVVKSNEKIEVDKVLPTTPSIIYKGNTEGVLFSLVQLSIMTGLEVGGEVNICDNLKVYLIKTINIISVDFNKKNIVLEFISGSMISARYTISNTNGLFIDKKVGKVNINVNR